MVTSVSENLFDIIGSSLQKLNHSLAEMTSAHANGISSTVTFNLSKILLPSKESTMLISTYSTPPSVSIQTTVSPVSPVTVLTTLNESAKEEMRNPMYGDAKIQKKKTQNHPLIIQSLIRIKRISQRISQIRIKARTSTMTIPTTTSTVKITTTTIMDTKNTCISEAACREINAVS